MRDLLARRVTRENGSRRQHPVRHESPFRRGYSIVARSGPPSPTVARPENSPPTVPVDSERSNEAGLYPCAPRGCSWCWCPEMLPGFAGRLVSEYFLETELSGPASESAGSAVDLARARLRAWRRGCDWLGPASTVQAVFEAAAVPLVDTLGFDAPAQVERAHRCVVATIRADREPLVLLVAAWDERLDPFWRTAVTEAIRRSAAWSILFNGTRLRVVEVERLYTRRFVEFEIDQALDEDRTFAALWALLHATAFQPRFERRSIPNSFARRAVGSACVGRVPIVARWRPRRIGTRARCAAASHGEVDRFGVTRRFVRAVVDGRLPDAVSALCRSARSGTAVACRLPRQLQHRLAARAGRAASSGVGVVGHLPGDLASGAQPAAGRAISGSRRSTAVCSRLPEPRWPIGGIWTTKRRGARCWRSRPGRRQTVPAASASRTATSASSNSVRSTKRCSTTSRGLIACRPDPRGPIVRVCQALGPRDTPRQRGARSAGPSERARCCLAGSEWGRPQGDRIVLHASTACRLSRSPHARSAGPRGRARRHPAAPDRRSRRWAAARSWSPPAAISRMPTRPRCSGTAPAGPATSASASASRPGGTIAERCLYGVDVNPMAVQLARLSLWLATLAADRPLTFLDHHLQTGDSLLGAWLSQMRRAPVSGRPVAPTPRGSSAVVRRHRGRRRAQGGAARPLQPGRAPRRHDRAGADEGARARRAQCPRHVAVAMEARRRCLVRALVRSGDAMVPASAFGALSDAILAGARRAAGPRHRASIWKRPPPSPGRPSLSLGARISRGLLRRRRHAAA